MTKVTNTKYKDRLFNFIFGSEENKAWTLSLYNAVNGSDYDDPNLIRFNTLKDVLYIGMKNDTSFIISNNMNVYEHQSTYNPNMPLRMLQYVGDLYSGYISENKYNKYGSDLISLPTPKLVVFYNGKREITDEVTLKLSDSFYEVGKDSADIEVIVHMINVNFSTDKEILKHCKPLWEYSWFIDEIRKNQSNKYKLETAVDLALQKMPDEFSIKEFLMINIKEVQGMLDTEYNEAEVMELFARDAQKKGIEVGIKGTINILKDLGLSENDIISKICEQYNLTQEQAQNYMS